MDHFTYRDGALHCEDVPASELAKQFGTPLYVYSSATLMRHFEQVRAAFAELDPLICYSIKSNGNLSLCKLLADAGCGFDVTSGGELHRALAAGGDPSKIIYAGVGKTDDEIAQALRVGIAAFNVESEAEIENIDRIAATLGKTAVAAIRVNPDVSLSATHVKTTTGKKETKFGVDLERAGRVIRASASRKHIRVAGIHMHLGSPINETEPYVKAIQKINALIDELEADGHRIEWFDLGGGFGVDYSTGQAMPIGNFAEVMVPLLRGRNYRLAIEPGRYISGNAGIMLTRVLYRKTGGQKKFVIVDAGMNDLIRPTLYEGFHFVWPTHIEPPKRGEDARVDGDEMVDVVGPVCESGDYLAKDRHLPVTQRGDLLAVHTAGAYGFVMASNYNHRPRAAEVLVDGANAKLVRKRETYADLTALEENL
ncbi:MAG: diaminopimelate decarboxylase [Planctomycetota bacterium]